MDSSLQMVRCWVVGVGMMEVVGSCWGTRVVVVLDAQWVQRMVEGVVEGVPCILGLPAVVEIVRSWREQVLVLVMEVPWVADVERPLVQSLDLVLALSALHRNQARLEVFLQAYFLEA